MSRTIMVHFDGKVLIPDRPVKLPIGKRLRIQVELDPLGNGSKGSKPRTVIGTGRFSSGLTDLSTNKKHLDGFGKS